ncbi:MAG: hypothetical protein NVSMB18_18590 [Acetobacteraceae bacterium]
MSSAGRLSITIALLAALTACSPRPPPSPPIVLHPTAPVRERVVLHRPAVRPARPSRATAAGGAPNRQAPADTVEPAALSASDRENLLRDFDAYLNKSPAK